MSMNVPIWNNAGVSPSEEKKQEGYAAGECLPAQHLNWLINQTFTNLTKLKMIYDYMPCYVVTGKYTGTGLYWTAKTNDLNGENNHGTQEDIFIDLGVTPLAVIVTNNTSQTVYKEWDISGTKAKDYYDTLFFIEGNNVFRYLTTNTYYPYGIVDGGFLANAGLNNAGTEYLYFAFVPIPTTD